MLSKEGAHHTRWLSQLEESSATDLRSKSRSIGGERNQPREPDHIRSTSQALQESVVDHDCLR